MADENSGVLFRSTDRRHENSPTHWGHAEVQGKHWKLAAWPAKEEFRERTEDVSVVATDKHSDDEVRFTLYFLDSEGNKPDYAGKAWGQEVVGWIKEKQQDTKYTKKGDKFLSLKFGGKQGGSEPQPASDAIPF